MLGGAHTPHPRQPLRGDPDGRGRARTDADGRTRTDGIRSCEETQHSTQGVLGTHGNRETQAFAEQERIRLRLRGKQRPISGQDAHRQ